MTRVPIVLVALLALADPTAAQQADTLPLPRFILTPFVGGRIPFGTEQTFFGPDSTTGVFLDEERGGGSVIGLDGELRMRGPFSVIAGVAYSTAGDVSFTVVELGNEDVDVLRYTRAGSTYLLARAGLSYRLPVPDPDVRRFRSLGSIVVAPALVRETPAAQSAINHFAVNLGYRAVLPLGSRRTALHLGFEDYLTFWDTDEYERRGPTDLDQPGLTAEFGSPRSNLFLFHTGVTFRFGARAPAAPVYVAPASAPVAGVGASGTTAIRICVVNEGELREVEATINPSTGDTLVNRRRFRELYPEAVGFAAGRDFYVRGEAVTVNRVRYVPIGLTRIIPANALIRAGEFQQVPVFREPGSGAPDVVYLPVRSGCEFQAYQREQGVRGVRG